MKIVFATLLVFLGTQQKLPSELQVSQLEDPRVRNSGIIVIGGGQNPVITNTQQQLPAIQLEQRPQSQIPNATFDVQFRDAPLVPVITTLAQYQGLNPVIAPDVTGTVTVDLKGVTLTQALDAILLPRLLQYRLEANMLRVERIQTESRQFKFDYITTSRSLSRSLSASSTAGGGSSFAGAGAAGGGGAGGGGGGGGSSASLSGSETTNVLNDIETQVKGFLSPDGKITFNKMAGIIFATDYPRYLDTVGLFLETVQNAVNRQVFIEARVIEVKLNEDSQLGVNWTAALKSVLNVQQPLSAGSGFQIAATRGTDFSAVLTALANQGTVNVRSAPTISTLNNQPAIIRVGHPSHKAITLHPVNQGGKRAV